MNSALNKLPSTSEGKMLYRGVEIKESDIKSFLSTHRMEFQIKNNPIIERNGTKVDSRYDNGKNGNKNEGKGSEFLTLDPVKVKIINVQPIQTK